ncbi:MAG: peptidase S8 [Roseiflexus castenholzii]|uniref:S8 family serine peptidase n=1 Tax=Roseiflexus castenholzii TaxID=120962 RepID=UPI000CBB82C1|nr:MAG: peptidase S8 [Roseiflexus castenholzii]
MQRLFVFVALIFTLAPLPKPIAASDAADELVVRLAEGWALTASARVHGPFAAPLNALLAQAGVREAQALGGGAYLLRFAHSFNHRAMIARLIRTPGVVYAERNHERQVLRVPNDEDIDRQWSLAVIQAFDAWNITTGSDMIIAILDTGVSPSHPDLRGRVLPGFDFVNNDDDPRDDDGHGTFTAGVAAAEGDNGIGAAGVCWRCRILPVKVLNRRGRGNDAAIAAGIRFAVDRGARIISMSFGGPDDSRVLREAVAYALERDVLLVAASGNGQAAGNLPNYPAAYPGVLAVSATGPDDAVTNFSTTGDFVALAAPGAGVWSTTWRRPSGDTYGFADGTSAACPHVAGAVALVWTVHPELTARQVNEVLMLGADDRGAPGKDPAYGHGRLNLFRALQVALDPNLLIRSRIEGVVRSVAPDQTTIALSSGQETRPDPNGFYRFENLPAGQYTIIARTPSGESLQHEVSLTGTALSVARVDFALDSAAVASAAFAPVSPQRGAVYFPETGHTLRGVFLSYWRAHGGLPVFGYPISEEFIERGEDGREALVQYFQRHRFELRPENRPPYNVQLSRMGDIILRTRGVDWFALPKGAPKPGCRYFPETGHSLCEPFLSAWRSNGLEFDRRRGAAEAENLALFGLPISEPQIETLPDGRLILVQWFERARFEDHGPDGILFGLLGEELARVRGWR